MSVNFFNWIRDGVKQSVLLGVSDAIETLGTPEDPANMHPSVAALLQNSGNSSETNAHSAPRVTGNVTGNAEQKGRKRLGRSLKDIDIKPA